MNGRFDWLSCQTKSDLLLAEGLFALQNSTPVQHSKVTNQQPGNYLISLNDELLYVGEAKNLSSRIRQQFGKNTSTFYKNYLKAGRNPVNDMGEFLVQTMETRIGRKEIEDFGIVNLPTPLNRFQLGKRKRVPKANDCAQWPEVQSCYKEIIAEGESQLFSRPLASMYESKVPECAGLYTVWTSEHKAPIYVGESSDIGKRHTTHCGYTYFSALRRHVGTVVLGYSLKTIKGKKRYFADDEDRSVTSFLQSCRFSFMPVSFGRIELEEFLIGKHQPLLNRKSK